MNKKGSAVFFGIIIGIFCFILGVLIIPFLTEDIATARIALDCTNVSITDGTKLTCLEHDLVVPYFIAFFVSLAAGILAGARN